MTVVDELQVLDDAKLPPTEENIQKYKDTLSQYPKMVQIIDNLNINDWKIFYQFNSKRHTPNEPSCKECGLSKCRKRSLSVDDFGIMIKIKVSGEYYDDRGTLIKNRISSTEITKSTKKMKNLIFSIDKYNNSSFITRWYYSDLLEAYKNLSDSSKQRSSKALLRHYGDSNLAFLYLKDAESSSITAGETLVDTIEVEISETHFYHMKFYPCLEFMQKENELFVLLAMHRTSL